MPKFVTFDTMEYMEALMKAGMDMEKAEVMTRATQRAISQSIEINDVATKSDIQKVEATIQRLETSTKSDIQRLESEIKQVEANTKKDIHAVETRLTRSMSENTWKIIGLLAGFQTLAFGVMGYLQYIH